MDQLPPAASYDDDPLWYKDAIIYELHVRAFHDSDGDGIGDFAGLSQKLDYLESLGITAIWLLPFYPSPLKDDGYDIADFTNIHPSYGSLEDFTTFLKEAHSRGIKVITELVINHTSDKHPWFQTARRAPEGSSKRDFYVWATSFNRYKGVRIIFKDFESSNWTADPIAGAYYWHRFYGHQPDLNFDSPQVRRAVFKVLDFWLKKGVDGLRLDAVPYLYEREGTSCENLPETHTFLKGLRTHIDRYFRNRMLLAEANQWPEEAAAYFGQDDECHMAFHFPIMPRLFMAIKMENRFPLIDILTQTPQIPPNSQWAMFLRNHDELTLEMVTDRERDYMYQVYARDREMRINLGIRRRLAPLLGNDRRAIELMNSLLFAMPGTPVIYYGDEIGMGDNVFLGDRNGVRTPMQWSSDRNAGFSRANPQRLYLPVIIDPEYHYESINVETQQNNPRSMLWWMRRAIHVRKQFKAFGRGTITFLKPHNPHILAFIRAYENERLLIVTNLSRFAQSVELELAEFAGMVPVELFGHTRFRPLTVDPWPMTLDPYAYYWFNLETEARPVAGVEPSTSLPILAVQESWEKVLARERISHLQVLLPRYLKKQRWFRGRNRDLHTVVVREDIRFVANERIFHLLLLEVEYRDGTREIYSLTLAFVQGERAEKLRRDAPLLPIATVQVEGREKGIIYDGFWDGEFTRRLLEMFLQNRRGRGNLGTLTVAFAADKAGLLRNMTVSGATTVQKRQWTTSIIYEDKLVLKIFRCLDPNPNPDVELGRFLSEANRFSATPALIASLEYSQNPHEQATLGILRPYIENQGNGWRTTLEYLDRYFEAAVTHPSELVTDPSQPVRPLLQLLDEQPPAIIKELAAEYLQLAGLLGRRTAELHQTLASNLLDQAFVPEEYTVFFQQAKYQSLRSHVTHVFRMLRTHRELIPASCNHLLCTVLEAESQIVGSFRHLKDHRLTSQRIRIHGNYNLEKVLYTGKDFFIIDFEGETARSLSERREKTSAVRDLAGMIRSFNYASHVSLVEQTTGPNPLHPQQLEPWRKLWCVWSSVSFLKEYLAAAGNAPFLPAEREELSLLLHVFILEKALYEVAFEFEHRREWITVALEGLIESMQV